MLHETSHMLPVQGKCVRHSIVHSAAVSTVRHVAMCWIGYWRRWHKWQETLQAPTAILHLASIEIALYSLKFKEISKFHVVTTARHLPNQSVAASMGCPGYPWISLWFQYFRIRRHISPNPATYFDILLNNRTGVQLAGYPYDSKEMPPLRWPIVALRWPIVTLGKPTVTLRWPIVTLHTSPYLHLPHLAIIRPLVKCNETSGGGKVATNFNVKLQGNRYRQSTIDNWQSTIDFLSRPFALQFPWASQLQYRLLTASIIEWNGVS